MKLAPNTHSVAVVEHEEMFEFAAKRHKLTEHLETADTVHHIHHNPSIAKHRRRHSLYPHVLGP